MIHVTQAIHMALPSEYGGVPEETMAFARDRGRAVHAACHYLSEDALDWDSLDHRVEPFVRGFQKFLADTGMTIDGMEVPVTHTRYAYQGTLDMIGMVASKQKRGRPQRWLVDIKCTAKVSDYTALQTAGYALAWQSMNGRKKVTRRFTLQLKGDGTYNRVEWKDAGDEKAFLACLTVANWMRQHGIEPDEHEEKEEDDG